MTDVSISLSDEQVSEIEAQIASGSYASASEVVEAALQAFLNPLPGPSLDQIERDIVAFETEIASGVEMLDADAARARIRQVLKV